jgi:hypothetical protein
MELKKGNVQRMSPLTEALIRISVCIEQKFPLIAERISPGLTMSQIELAIGDLPYRLPSEVYELYQWSGGLAQGEEDSMTGIFSWYQLSLLSLPIAIDEAIGFEDPFYEEFSARYISNSLFPLFGADKQWLCTVIQSNTNMHPPLIYVNELKQSIIYCNSLTNMIETVADCFELDVVSNNEFGGISYDLDRFTQVYRKNNPNLLELSLERLRQELALFQDNPRNKALSCKVFEEFQKQIYALDFLWGEIDITQVSSGSLEPLIAAANSEDEDISELARRGLRQINYTD